MQEAQGIILHVPMFTGRIKVESWDKQLPIPDDQYPGWDTDPKTLLAVPNRKLVGFTDEPLNSYTRAFYNWLVSQMMGFSPSDSPTFGDGFLNWKDYLTGANRNISPTVMDLGQGETATNAGYRRLTDDIAGILIGTGSAAFTFDDWGVSGLNNTFQIPHGTGSGEMSHVASEISQRSWSGGTRQFTGVYARFFNNNSSGAITVNEVVLRPELAGIGNGRMVVARDVITPIEVNPGGQLKVTYTQLSPVFPS